MKTNKIWEINLINMICSITLLTIHYFQEIQSSSMELAKNVRYYKHDFVIAVIVKAKFHCSFFFIPWIVNILFEYRIVNFVLTTTSEQRPHAKYDQRLPKSCFKYHKNLSTTTPLNQICHALKCLSCKFKTNFI
jgi:hypothetical protein